MNQIAQREYFFILVGGVLALLVVFLANGRFPSLTTPILSNDIDQHRINSALPALQDGLTITQSFVPEHNALTAVSIVLVEYEGTPDTDNGRLLFTLFDDTGQTVQTTNVAISELEHNQTFTLQFPPIANSRNRQFILQLSAEGNTNYSVWGYDLNVYEAGEATLSDPELFTFAKDFRFTTQYQLTLAEAVRLLGMRLWQDGTILLLAMLMIPLPGALALYFFSPSRRWEWAARWGTAVALGVALWPIIWYFTSLVGLRWQGTALWLVIIGGWLLYLRLTYERFSVSAFHRFSLRPSTVCLVLILLGGLAVRLLAIRDMAFPLWVDSSRHALITAVMVEKGQVLTNYHPLLPIDTFPYHFGFHTLPTMLLLMGDFPLERLLLLLGQLLNGLVPLSMYSAVYLLTRRRGTAVFAAFLVAFPFYFPGYYATWGRFTQLTGMIIMPLLLLFTWKLVRGGRVWRSTWWLVGVLAAGLFLVHFRVFLLYVPFVLLVWPFGWRKNGRLLEKAGALALLLVAGRAYTLWRLNQSFFSSANQPIQNYNLFPFDYVNAGWEQYYIWMAGGLLPFLIFGMISWRRWGYFPLMLVVWTAVLFGLVGGDMFGLSARSIINLNSMYITLFVPLAFFLAIMLEQINRFIGQWPLGAKLPFWLSFGALCTLLLIFGARLQINILNPATVLARPPDATVMRWIERNVPNDAKFAVGSRLWLGNTWTGQDGGAWIVPLTGRQSATPPADYIYDLELFQEVNRFNEAAVEIDNWSDAETAVWLQEQGITHIFVGAGGGQFDPSQLAQNLKLELVYGQDGAFVFAIRGQGSGIGDQ